MNIQETIITDSTAALKSGHEKARTILTGLLSEIKNEAIKLRVETLPEEKVTDVLVKEISKRNKSIEEVLKRDVTTDAARIDSFIAVQKEEIAFIQKYIATQLAEIESAMLSKEDIVSLIATAIEKIGTTKKFTGKIIAEVVTQVTAAKKTIDKKLLADLVKEKLV